MSETCYLRLAEKWMFVGHMSPGMQTDYHT